MSSVCQGLFLILVSHSGPVGSGAREVRGHVLGHDLLAGGVRAVLGGGLIASGGLYIP